MHNFQTPPTMHKRNIFKQQRPDFEQLAIEYEEFAPYVQKGSYVDFKDPASLRALNVVLLKKYFNLSIEIPLDRLIPSVTLRLNYIHWIEDLVENIKDHTIVGIDIGCGASCIYPLLGNKINKWKFIATEIDEKSRKFAYENVTRNNADEFIAVHEVSNDSSPLGLFTENFEAFQHVDFCMCNPPFLSENEEVNNLPPQLDSISTASEGESFTQGGEVAFVKQMIDDSLVIGENITWYTSMLGKESSIVPVTHYLRMMNIDSYTTATLQQGKTTRWVVAWSFTETPKPVPKNRDLKKKPKKQKPIFLVPSDAFCKSNEISNIADISTMESESVFTIMLQLAEIMSRELTKLGITVDGPDQISLQDRPAYEITAKVFENTWIHQRGSKKRKEKLLETAGTAGDWKQLEHPYNSNIFGNPYHPHQIGGNPYKWEHSTPEVSADSGNGNGAENTKKRKMNDPGASSSSCNQHHSNKLVDPLFELSCTVGRTSQFGLDNSDCIVFCFLCVSGRRDLFSELFTYLRNVFQGTQLNFKLYL